MKPRRPSSPAGRTPRNSFRNSSPASGRAGNSPAPRSALLLACGHESPCGRAVNSGSSPRQAGWTWNTDSPSKAGFWRTSSSLPYWKAWKNPWFADARIKTAATILQRCSDKAVRDANLVRFVRLQKPLAEILGERAPGDESARQEAAERCADWSRHPKASKMTNSDHRPTSTPTVAGGRRGGQTPGQNGLFVGGSPG